MAKKKKPPKPVKRYKRVVKRYSLPVNLYKWLLLLNILDSYARQKDDFLKQYAGADNINACYSFYAIRKDQVASKFRSPYGLQARQWKLALKDALETIDRYWAALAAGWEKNIYASSSLSKEEKFYLLKVISSRKLLHLFLQQESELRLPKIELSAEKCKRCLRFLKRLLKKTVKRAPRVRIKRSFTAEPETYRVFIHNGRQYIAFTTKEPGHRVIIPLSGRAKISGQIRIVFDFEKQRIEIHHLVKSRVKNQKPKGKTIGIDLGITEVFTDSDGERWGIKFGPTINHASDKQKEKGKKRNKLYALEKKYREQGKKHKARSIRRYNLGRKKQKRKHDRSQEELARQVNESISAFLVAKQPKKVIYEDLSQMRGKAKSKKLSRLVAAWIRRTIRQRLEFKIVSQGGSLLEPVVYPLTSFGTTTNIRNLASLERLSVNCAHSSRVCPLCGWVAPENRKGDRFKCQFCSHTAACDWTAALEILRREKDSDIRLWTPRNQVYRVLIERFRRRLENYDDQLHLSRQDWESVRKEFGEEVDTLLLKLGADVGGCCNYRSGLKYVQRKVSA